jgi:spermidine/putrescine transport system permease protein
VDGKLPAAGPAPRRKLAGRLRLAPAALLFALFFVAPFGYFFVVSFWKVRLFKLLPGLSLDNYTNAYDDYLGPLVFTFVIALAIATLTTLLAFCFAYLIRFRAGRFGPALLFITLITMFGGYLVKIYAWKSILGKFGIMNSGLMGLGIIDEPILWLLYNPGAVVVTLTHFLIPFAVLPIYGSLRAIEDTPIEAARDLGAGSWRVLVDIVLPQCQPGLLVGFALAFLISAGDYVTPRLVGGPYTSMVGNFVESQFIMRLNAPQGSALAFTILAACLLALAAIRFAMRAALRPR